MIKIYAFCALILFSASVGAREAPAVRDLLWESAGSLEMRFANACESSYASVLPAGDPTMRRILSVVRLIRKSLPGPKPKSAEARPAPIQIPEPSQILEPSQIPEPSQTRAEGKKAAAQTDL